MRRQGSAVQDDLPTVASGGLYLVGEHLVRGPGRSRFAVVGAHGAYTGCYCVRGNRIRYLDDPCFWAFGELLDGALHHAGFVMIRR